MKKKSNLKLRNWIYKPNEEARKKAYQLLASDFKKRFSTTKVEITKAD